MPPTCRRLALLALALLAPAAALPATDAVKPLVLLVSIDGLKPEAVTEAAAHGLKVPNLRALMTDGMYASTVRGVLPTLTFPSHSTLLTGASPDKHGILANTTFDPFNKNDKGWYWYAEDFKVPTLWDAVAATHRVTANIYWPVSVGAHIDYNLPQIWRRYTDDDLKLQRALSTPDLEQALAPGLGRYPAGGEETVTDDEIRAKYAIKLLETKHPDFMTVYLAGLDTQEHESGPFTPPANAVLERLDTVVGRLREAAEQLAPGRATLCVVSDHGFATIEHDVNLYSAFLEEGLFSVDANNTIIAWKAMPWPAGGSAAVMLADPKDEATRVKVAALLKRLAADPSNGIDRVLAPAEIASLRGFPDAAFLVGFKIGYEIAYALKGPLIVPPANKGMHGFLPDRPEMRSSFFLVGPRIPKHKNLGEIDMRRIAPTLANVLGVKLAGAELESLSIEPAR